VKNKKILLVDDEKAILTILNIRLKVMGYDVVNAGDGQEALDMLDSTTPDIMLLDIIMPGINGFEVLRKLRLNSQLPVIVYSARPENRQEALRMGANDFLAKPFDVDYLAKRIELLLDHKGQSC
jgi:DNA-binding response OmpR family regulator